MLEQIREKAPRWLVSTILLLLVVPFALWGVNSYVRPSGGVAAARAPDAIRVPASRSRSKPARLPSSRLVKASKTA